LFEDKPGGDEVGREGDVDCVGGTGGVVAEDFKAEGVCKGSDCAFGGFDCWMVLTRINNIKIIDLRV
jgi:hypothetical protein